MANTGRCAWAVSLVVGAAAGIGRADVTAVSDDGLWQVLDAVPAGAERAAAWVRPGVFAPAKLDRAGFERLLGAAPREGAGAPLEIQLPTPRGGLARFRVVESPVMEPALAAKFPEIRTYVAQGVDDPAATARLDMTPAGFHAQVLAPSGAVYIDPYSRGDDTLYAVYFKRDYRKAGGAFRCLTDAHHRAHAARGGGGAGPDTSGDSLRTYRLACAGTGEYTLFHGGTAAQGLAAIVTTVNRVTGIYEQEFSARLVLVANNNLLVYTNPATDPYTNQDPGAMLAQNQTTCNAVIGNANFDVGHVLGTGGGGVAYLQAVCNSALKAQGVSGLDSPVGDPFDVDYVAHEMGHQFGGNHTQNGCSNNNTATAVEPGSASTIMGYAGICGGDDLQPHSDPYFHAVNHAEIRAFMTGGGASCGVLTSTGNGVPTVNAGPDYTVPSRTPFALTASATDPNGDQLSYCWEERDLGPYQNAVGGQFPDNGSSPIFRSFNPAASPARIFPRLQDLLNNTTVIGEFLPTTNRTMNFRCTVRDNRAGGAGVNADDARVTVVATAGPFRVTFPNAAASLSGVQTVTWDVAGTGAAPISCATVRIELSTDGGNTWPVILAAATPNDGSEQVTLPNSPTTAARVRVSAVGNIFFDVSNANFTITAGACYVNCDGSTTAPILNVNDFICFQTRFAAGDSYANCDGSTAAPVLNVNDFVCFQQGFAAGCP